jgi:gamma-glutamylcyclotransferase (GGCT)/AIG2-like uncharacterized protein YtfP
MEQTTCYLFNYGSNYPEQLEDRGVKVVPLSNEEKLRFSEARIKHEKYVQAFVRNAIRTFTNSVPTSRGGVATLVEEQGEVVLGYICKIDINDLNTLDEFEGVSSNKYERKTIPVMIGMTSSSLQTEAIVYVMTSAFLKNKSQGYVAPKEDYLKKITKTLNICWRKSDPVLGTRDFKTTDINLHIGKRFWGRNPDYTPL